MITNQHKTSSEKTLLNLGCGQTRPSNWINTDCSINSLLQQNSFFHFLLASILKRTAYNSSNCYYMDLNKKWQFSSNSIDVVYGSHVFEHLTLTSANLFLEEAYRTLKPKGIIRIVVPDLYKLSKNYIESFEKGIDNSSKDFLYCLNLNRENAYYPNRTFIEKCLNLLQDHPHQHKYMYDSLSLKKILSSFGFSNIYECSYGISSYIEEIQEVEFTKEGIPSIYIEAIKSL